MITHELLGQLTKASKAWAPEVIPATLLRDIVVAVETGKVSRGKAMIFG